MNVVDRSPALKLLTTDYTAHLLGFKAATLRDPRFRRRHNLRAVRFGRCLRFRVEDVERWINGAREQNHEHADRADIPHV